METDNGHETGRARNSLNDVEPQPATKRRRIALACTACRIRKSKCNGVRPRCQSCDNLGFDCVYEFSAKAANIIIHKDAFVALEERVRALEHMVGTHKKLPSADDNGSQQHEGMASDSRSASGFEPSLATDTVVVNIENDQEPTTDGMAVSVMDEQDTAFFGSSSNIAFMREVFRAMARDESAQLGANASTQSGEKIGMHDALMISLSRPPSPPRSVEECHRAVPNALPPGNQTRNLIRAYFSNAGLLFPYIHEPTFLETYERMQDRNIRSPVRRTWLGLLNMMLALSACTGGWPAEDATANLAVQSDVFYRRARQLCKTQMMRGTSLEMVQYLLLTCQYLQGTQKSVQTWMTHGLAVKAAFSIGLHLRSTSTRFSPIEQETRVRTWHGLIILDRNMSMTFGRPSAIPEEYVKIDLPRPIGGGHDRASIGFYNATIGLYKIHYKIIILLYRNNMDCEKSMSEMEMLAQIFQLELQLNEWETSLPPALRLRSPSALPEGDIQDPIPERFRLVLTLRALNTRVLLHRPILTKVLAGFYAAGQVQPQRPFSQMLANYSQACIESAKSIVAIIHAVLTEPRLGKNFLGAWWYTLYYTFNASLVIFAELLLPRGHNAGAETAGQQPNLVEGRRFLQCAVNALLCLDTENPILHKCIENLRQFLKAVDKRSEHFSSSFLFFAHFLRRPTFPPLTQGLRTASETLSPLSSSLVASPPVVTAATPTLQLSHGAHGADSSIDHVLPNFLGGGPTLGRKHQLEDDFEFGQVLADEFQRWF
ncbi:hypothetical protein MKZ38_004843 [Zalerion maritima]|uniref:Zn(2)-C6 fungal-type domain-containing protein n=1 Tax=Zalerion maritima TaxID=339359 RepID=A0AAD5RKT5_9PEZI|nr:hypothetical protein MKZ38_004843 [Zalerion maritima]